ncbi:zinc finger domain-containing protein [Streptomyces venezuelae]
MITFEEAGRLLGLAAARDQRIVGDADILAWHSDLNAAGVSYQDAEAALTRFYAVEMAGLEPEDRRRVTTPDVIGIARKIRNERLANFVYEPPPGDDDPHYLARLRGQLEATANGRRSAPSEQLALEGGPHPDVARALAAVGQSVPDEDEGTNSVRRPGPLGIECPKCTAAIGRPCRTPGGKERAPHPARKGETSNPEEERAEMERRRAASAASLRRREEETA